MSGCFEVSNVVSTNETFQNRTHWITDYCILITLGKAHLHKYLV